METLLQVQGMVSGLHDQLVCFHYQMEGMEAG